MADNPILGALAGPVELGVREWSRLDWHDRCTEAARAGLGGVGLWHADLEHQLERRSLEDIKRIFDDAGLEVLELEFLTDWFLPKGQDRKSAQAREDMLFEAAAELDARHIKVGNMFGRPCEPDRLAEQYAALCERAYRRHSALIGYELTCFDPAVATLDQAVRLVEAAGADNAGVILDTWHLGKLGVAPAELLNLPSRCVVHVELSDGSARNLPNLLLEAATGRLMPGEGVFDLRGYVEAIRRLGYDGPWGVEVISTESQTLPLPELARRAYAGGAACLSA
ncbi:sugar phosphate isomerase/epimerase [Thermocatellispora tengchongensis]|uniref:Sugar phosphate isomerase/epimerase n=1 Tax=Thermocatellispora tengchongensis TaxID=1073253 RepID=A0A840PDX0_9ACTN|nr:sugar phosphate isomerase/epimerase [Thermocatellispora tengchongensis]MBB5136133.1 sugar phosphate isomerase/epimerase [Thermocatellispora tengchongensis]